MKNLTILIFSFLFVIGGCEQTNTPASTNEPTSNSGNIAFTFDKANAPAAVKTLTATLTRSGHTSLTKTLNIVTDTSATMLFSEVAVGTWKVKVEAKDESGKVLYSGEADVNVLEGTVTQVHLTLTPVLTGIGSVQINVTWGGFPSNFPKTYGGNLADKGMTLTQTKDGGYILGGITKSYGSGGDAWLVKVDANGFLSWSKFYGGAKEDRVNDIVQTEDGGFLFAGYTTESDEDSWIVKIDSLGTVQWEKKYAGSGHDAFLKIKKGLDGAYFLCGYYSNEKFFEGRVVKMTPAGEVLWSKTYGGSGGDFAMNILPLSDGSSLVVGNNGSIPGQYYDFWVFKISETGDTLWQRTHGGSGDDRVAGIVPTLDGNFILTGYTTSYGNGTQDAWVIGIDGSGNKLWSKTFGDFGTDYLLNIVSGEDNNYFCAGVSSSYGNGNQGWILKIDKIGNFLWSKTYGGIYSETINDHEITKDGGIVFAGISSSTISGSDDFWLGKTDADGNLK